jgi:tetratricopeptide (TPR) repeat protein
VAMVDPEQNFDQIVLTDETPAEAVAEAAHSAEPAEVAATKSQVQAEAESPVQVVPEVAAIEHAAYDEYLKDTQSSLETQAGESGEQEAAASQEPVAKIDASGDVQIEMDTRNAHVWNELGNVYFNTGAFDDSIAAYTKAIELDRWFAWPYSNLALAYMQKGRFAEAILLYQRSIELFVSDKDKAISWNRLGNVYRRLNDYDNAIAAYQRADELDPENTTLSLQSRFSLLGTFSMEQKPSYAA